MVKPINKIGPSGKYCSGPLPLNISIGVSFLIHYHYIENSAPFPSNLFICNPGGDLDPPTLTAVFHWPVRHSQIICGFTLDAPSSAETAVGACLCRLEKFFRHSSDSQITHYVQCIDRYVHTCLYVSKPSCCGANSYIDAFLANSKSPRPVYNSGKRERSRNAYSHALF